MSPFVPTDTELTYKVALALTPGITAEIVRHLDNCGISYEDFFTLKMPELSGRLGGTDNTRIRNLDRQQALVRAREEVRFIQKHSIRAIYLLDDDYPRLLREIPDAPVMIFVLGNCSLDFSPSLAVVGTRRCTPYGINFCDSFITEIAGYYPEAAVISGLAYGIDAAAHNAALKNRLTTVAVLAHGLDTIYPASHRNLARDILRAGGALVTEFPSATKPFRGNFLQRNRIVSGLTELTFVVESEVKGGAMSTANYAFSYDREVFALPGRYTDKTSSGTNMLVARGKAHIYTSIGDLMNTMGWPISSLDNVKPPQRNLFPELEGDSARVYSVLQKQRRPLSVDDLHVETRLPVSVLLSVVTELEFDGIVLRLPGGRYEAQG